jgi:hypothetical protein
VYARNKKSIALDLKAPEAPGIILDLAAHFDVMIESFRFRYLERLAVGPDALLARNPKLVLVRVSGFGQTGPYAKRPGFGTLVEAMSGFASRNGFEDREPVLPPLALADMIAGLSGAMATVIAVRNVEGQRWARSGDRRQPAGVDLLDPRSRGRHLQALAQGPKARGQRLRGHLAAERLPHQRRRLGRHLGLHPGHDGAAVPSHRP